MKCQDCKFWEFARVRNTVIVGVCHRYPPTVISVEQDDFQPTTVTTDWCGEFQAKEVNQMKPMKADADECWTPAPKIDPNKPLQTEWKESDGKKQTFESAPKKSADEVMPNET